jgi:hypothetical protein
LHRFAEMGIFLFILFISIFSIAIVRFPLFSKSNLKTSVLLGVFYLKVLSGIAITIIYTYYYKDRSTSDIYKYFDDAKIICSAIKEQPKVYLELVFGLNENSPEHIKYTSQMRNWSSLDENWLNYTKTKDTNFFNSNRIVTRINAVLIPISNENIFIHVLFFSFLSFIGLFYLYKQISIQFKENNLLIFIIVFLLPSTLLWCSGTLKDTLVLSFVNIFVYRLFKIEEQRINIISTLFLILLIYLIVLTKYYVAIALIAVLLGFTFKRVFKTRTLNSYLIVTCALLIFSLILPLISTTFNVWQVLIDKREESLKTAIWAEANHQIFYNTISNQIGDILINIPLSIFNGVFRPFIWEAGNSPFILISGAENSLIALFLMYCLYKIDLKKLNNELLLFFLFFSIFSAFIIGFTTPVTGGLVRYKTIFIVYLLLSSILLSTRKFMIPQRVNNLILK